MAAATPSPSSFTSKPNPSTSPRSHSPIVHPAPEGLASQSQSSMGVSSVRDDYRPPASGETPLPKEESSSKTGGNKDQASEVLASSVPSPQLSTSSAKANPSDDESKDIGGYSSSGLEKVSRMFGCFAGLIPVIFVSSVCFTYAPLYLFYGESYGIHAATFVAVAGIVYSIFSSLYWEMIPSYQLSRENKEGKFWRNLIDLTSTYFITSAFTTAVWKLPDITSTQGSIAFSVTFGLAYLLSKNYHKKLFRPPTGFQQKAE